MECIRQIWGWFLEPLQGLVSMLVGAFIGAHIAFKYQRHADELKQREESISALKIAQGSIHSHWSALQEIHEFLAVHRSDLANQKLDTQDIIRVRTILPLNVPSIAFLFDGKHADLIQDAMLVEGASRTALAGLARRTELIDRLQQGARYMHDTGVNQFRSEVDLIQCRIFVQLTESIEQEARKACSDAEKVFYKLKAAGEELFPGKKFLTLEELPKR